MTSLINELAYVVIEGADLDAWARFGEHLLGFEVRRNGDALTMKMDGRAQRYLILAGGGSAYPTLAWEIADAQAFTLVQNRLKALGIETTRLSEEEIRIRQADGGVRFVCRNGISHELVYGLVGEGAFQSSGDVTGFVTGRGGVGHTAWMIPNVDAMDELMLGAFEMSLREDISAPAMRGHFYGCNQRHHSLAAFGDKPLQLEHLMVEMAELDDVGRAMDRCEMLGYKLLQPLGRHRTDHMVSFYVETPSGFGMEVGFNGVLCGDDWIEHREERRRRPWGHGAAIRNHQREAAAVHTGKADA